MKRRRAVLLTILFAVVLPVAIWLIRRARPENAMPSVGAARFPSKEELFVRAEKVAPDDPRLPLLLQQIISSSKEKQDFERFIPIASAAIERAPNNGIRAQMARALGMAHAGIGEVEKARSFYELAMREVPGSPTSDHAKALLYELDHLRVGQPAPEFSSYGLDNKPVRLANFRGKVILLDFWATWCEPCVADQAHLKALHEKFRDRGLVILGVSLDKDREALEQMVKYKGLSWPHIFDGESWEGPAARTYGIDGIPAYYIVNRDGRIAARTHTKHKLEEELSKLIESASAP